MLLALDQQPNSIPQAGCICQTHLCTPLVWQTFRYSFSDVRIETVGQVLYACRHIMLDIGNDVDVAEANDLMKGWCD